ncbi:MAG: hypothetical protein JSS43_16785 [Proteobacteria bacterium]|nr:hypothetical protein [Pseudomonadota bacterium]
MRQVREFLRLKHACGQSERRTAGAIGISRYTVAEYLRRAAVVGLTWPVPPDLDDAALERKLFTPPGSAARETLRPQPDWARIHSELRLPLHFATSDSSACEVQRKPTKSRSNVFVSLQLCRLIPRRLTV